MKIPRGWTIKSLSEVVAIQRGFDLPHHARRPGPYPVLTSGDTGGFHDEGPIAGPGITIGRATNLGKPKWSESDFWPHNTTMFVKDFMGNDPRWVFHLFENTDLAGFDSGSVQPMLNRNYIAEVPVLVPPVPEQRAIAEVLGSLDDKIAANTKLIRIAEDFCLARLQPFSPTVPLCEVSNHYKKSIRPENIDVPTVAYYSLPAYDLTRRPETTPPGEIKSSKFEVRKPSVLISKLNPRFPRVWNVAEIPDVPALASTEFLVLEPSCSSTSVLWSILRQPVFGRSLESKVAGTSGSHQRVRPADLLETMIIDPRILDDRARAEISGAGEAAESRRTENKTLTAARDAFLPHLMSGKLRIADAEVLICGAEQ